MGPRVLLLAGMLAVFPTLTSAQSSGVPAFPGFGKKVPADDVPLKPIEPSEHSLNLRMVDNSPKMTGFPKGTVLDIMGIELGMTIEEVRSSFAGKPAMKEPYWSTVFASNNQNGSETEIKYPSRLESVKRRWNGTPDRRAKGTPLQDGGCARAS